MDNSIPSRPADLPCGGWTEAAALEVRPTTFLYAEAITRFGRAIGSAKTGDLATAHGELEKLQALQQTLAGKPEFAYWAAQTEVLSNAAAGWIARAEGHNEDAAKRLQAAADLEDASEKHVAMENRQNGVPLAVYFSSGSRPRRPMRITLFTDLAILSSSIYRHPAGPAAAEQAVAGVPGPWLER